jgi:hypothetical protein
MGDTGDVSAFFSLVKYVGIALLVLMTVLIVIYGIAAIGAAISPHIGLFGLFRS